MTFAKGGSKGPPFPAPFNVVVLDTIVYFGSYGFSANL
jgi:hypothetical protein